MLSDVLAGGDIRSWFCKLIPSTDLLLELSCRKKWSSAEIDCILKSLKMRYQGARKAGLIATTTRRTLVNSIIQFSRRHPDSNFVVNLPTQLSSEEYYLLRRTICAQRPYYGAIITCPLGEFGGFSQWHYQAWVLNVQFESTVCEYYIQSFLLEMLAILRENETWRCLPRQLFGYILAFLRLRCQLPVKYTSIL